MQPLVVEYLTRSKVGYDLTLPRLGKWVPRGNRDHFVQHHTVGDDDDTTPNTWSRADALDYAVRLQTIRPDLGKDVPYNFVAFVLEPDQADVLVVEGRGWDRSGAHTVDPDRPGSENSDLIAISWAGDFRVPGGAVARGWPDHLYAVGAWAKAEMERMGGFDIDPDATTGHRDHKATSCPGDLVYDNLSVFNAGLGASLPPTWTEDIINDLPLLWLYAGYNNPPDGSEKRTHQYSWVQRAQACLAIEGHIASNTFDDQHSPDGLFGPGTDAAVRAFQKAKGLTVDGYVGENTWKALLAVD